MGLGLVEIVMDVESECDVRFDDDIFKRTNTVGDLCREAVEASTKQKGALTDAERQFMIRRVHQVIAESLGVDVSTVNDTDRFIEDYKID